MGTCDKSQMSLFEKMKMNEINGNCNHVWIDPSPVWNEHIKRIWHENTVTFIFGLLEQIVQTSVSFAYDRNVVNTENLLTVQSSF